jgi:cytochrome P450
MASVPSVSPELDFDWMQPGALGDTYLERLQRIQQQTPVFWSEHQKSWIVTRHADILAGYKDEARLSAHRFHLRLEQHAREKGEPEGELLKAVRRWVLNLDGMDHARLRTLLLKPFSKPQIDRYRDAVRANFVQLLERSAARERFDFVNELAFPYSAQTLLHIIGMSHVITPEELFKMSQSIVVALGGRLTEEDLKAGDRAISTINSKIVREIEECRRAPRDDLLTNLVTLSENGDRLSESEIVSLYQVLFLAAIDTTAYTLSLIVHVLDRSPEHREYIRSHLDRMPLIVEELQRYVGMMNMNFRIATVDFEWHGQQIKSGNSVMFMLAVGNRDPQVFEDPNTLNFDRKRKPTLMFAPGLHHCLGHFIAKMGLEVALEELFGRSERVRVLETPEYLPNYMTRSFGQLMVRLEPLA